MKSFKTGLQAILYVILVVGLHLILIYFLKIRIEGWGTELLNISFKVYFIPLLLCFINSFLFIRTQRIKYNAIWFLVTMLSSLLLFYFSMQCKMTVIVNMELSFLLNFFQNIKWKCSFCFLGVFLLYNLS